MRNIKARKINETARLGLANILAYIPSPGKTTAQILRRSLEGAVSLRPANSNPPIHNGSHGAVQRPPVLLEPDPPGSPNAAAEMLRLSERLMITVGSE